MAGWWGAYEDGAVAVLGRKKNIRVLLASQPLRGGIEMRQISGGLLLQERDAIDAPGDDPLNWTLATGSPADPETMADLIFAWRACRAVKSNAIVIATDGATVGVGMGQVNRVDAARLAVERGGDRVRGGGIRRLLSVPRRAQRLNVLGVAIEVAVGAVLAGLTRRPDVDARVAANAGCTRDVESCIQRPQRYQSAHKETGRAGQSRYGRELATQH